MTEKTLVEIEKEFNDDYMHVALGFRKNNIAPETALEIIGYYKKHILRSYMNHHDQVEGLNDLATKYLNLYKKLEHDIYEKQYSAYIIEIENKAIVCLNESLLNKCRKKLENTNHIVKEVVICQSEQDIEKILPQEQPSLKDNFAYLEFHGLPQDNKKQANSDDIINTFGESYE